MANGHTGWDGMGVDDNIWGDTLSSKRHIFLAVRDSNGALLPMSRCKFVAHLRDAYRSDADLCEFEALRISCQHDVINNSALRSPQWCAGISKPAYTLESQWLPVPPPPPPVAVVPGAAGSGTSLPMIISSPTTLTPGGTSPSASSFSYVPCRIRVVC